MRLARDLRRGVVPAVALDWGHPFQTLPSMPSDLPPPLPPLASGLRAIANGDF